MTLKPRPPGRSISELRALTPARVGLGRVGTGLPTQALLDFTLDHARARDAVHANFDAAGIVAGIQALGVTAYRVSSHANHRKDYLRRPDLGRKLDVASREFLSGCEFKSSDIVIVIGDGLSPAAVNTHAVNLVKNLLPRCAAEAITVGGVVVASGARVALGDEIGVLTRARMIVMLIGERPGLSAPQSLGVYLTFDPRPGLTDAERNCVSNIHTTGLSYDEAGFKIAWLVREGLGRQLSGVGLKDESGYQAPASIASTVKLPR
jgi:ethanolamine ammonia-lyase small subunit